MTDTSEKIKSESEFWDKNISEMMTDKEKEDLIVLKGEYEDKLKPFLSYFQLEKAARYVIESLGDIEGKKILDVGCGNGFMTTMLARQGAIVTSIDVSEQSVELTRNRAMANGVEAQVTARVMDFEEELEFEKDSFDHVVGNFVLHHTDLNLTGATLHRVLREGGKAIFVETSALNPILVMARNGITGRFGVPKYGTADEAPLSWEQTRILDRIFEGKIKLVFPSFIFFRLLPGYFRFFAGPTMKRLFFRLDSATFNLFPGLRKYTYYMVVEMSK